MYVEIKLLQGLGIRVFGEGLAGLDCVKMSCLNTDPFTFLKESEIEEKLTMFWKFHLKVKMTLMLGIFAITGDM